MILIRQMVSPFGCLTSAARQWKTSGLDLSYVQGYGFMRIESSICSDSDNLKK